ncbi:uncharacterized protein PHACADRAFT_249113 [Phanerochaete carnosa HHB-10118-sp]|uniref:Uncharacterized protein n=1 Tax=Phanerochaete carnosa (strain HHB-10118-sp) TaxID=650164 RepID=K5WHZ2_PHACS|nr:uncharacterized protein PHACADRAFT_249113 [Phanerochaete carnosa HHB-10118-sp]EKM58975.1 hypothetical protein PHACADRAFT_249113 [Phanerochaete carnosa HHB-10118-sp]
MPRIPGVHSAMHYVCPALQIPLVAAVCVGDTDTFELSHLCDADLEPTLILNSACRTYSSHDTADPPSSAHVFRRWKPSMAENVCGIPFLCMGTPPTLWIAMSAILHQRHTWGLPHPVIGVLHSPSSTEISFVFGWYTENYTEHNFVSKSTPSSILTFS